MDEVVRPAQPGDAALLRQLEQEARAALADQRGGPQLLAEQPPVGDWSVVGPDRSVLVATLDGHLVGYLELAHTAEAAVVRQVYVQPEARELGFGDGMLDAAMQLARQRGADVIEGTALPGDRETKNLYERAGITARKIIVSKHL